MPNIVIALTPQQAARLGDALAVGGVPANAEQVRARLLQFETGNEQTTGDAEARATLAAEGW